MCMKRHAQKYSLLFYLKAKNGKYQMSANREINLKKYKKLLCAHFAQYDKTIKTNELKLCQHRAPKEC